MANVFTKWFKNQKSEIDLGETPSSSEDKVNENDYWTRMANFQPVLGLVNSNQQYLINGYGGGVTSNLGAYNPVADIGTAHDASTYTQVGPPPNNGNTWQMFDNVYQTNVFAKMIIDIPAEDMTKNWREFICDDPEIAEIRQKAEEDLEIKVHFKDAVRYGNMYGTSALLIDTGLEDGDPRYMQPLTDDEVIRNKLRGFGVVFVSQMNPNGGPDLDPLSSHLGKPEYYSITGTTVFTVHESRLILFDGVELPLWARINQGGFGLSVFIPVWNELVNLKTLSASLINQAMKSNIDHLGVNDFLNLAASECRGDHALSAYFTARKNILSNQRIMVSDAEDKFTRNELSNLSSWPDLLKFNIQVVVGSVGIPLNRAIAEHISGFNSGDAELLTWADTIATKQKQKTSQLKKIDELIELSTFGERKDITYRFLPIFTESETQISNRVSTNSATDSQYLNEGLLSKEIVLKRMQEEGFYSISDGYIEEVAKKEKEMEDFAPQVGDDELLESLQRQTDTGDVNFAQPLDALK
jgi:phage-related protein (TIGR01555 family)